MASLSFKIELSSKADPNRTLVSNIGRVIVKKLAIKFDGNIILEVDDFQYLHATKTCGKQNSKREML